MEFEKLENIVKPYSRPGKFSINFDDSAIYCLRIVVLFINTNSYSETKLISYI